MKKVLLSLGMAAILFSSCQKTNSDETENTNTVSRCASYEVLQEQLKNDPTLQSRMDNFEQIVQNNIKAGKLINGVINIPVVVNVIYKTTAQNIALGQIQSQIDVLNEDYNALNADYASVPTLFAGVKASVGIKFYLDTVRRKLTTVTSWSTNNAVKKTSSGGLDPLYPTYKLNMWACNLGSGLLGYAQFPGGASATDGVVILYSAFGSKLKYPSSTYTTTYDRGRTATHEVGHWMNLRHIWGDATCGSDLVGDTPTHNTANYGCPVYPHKSTCTGTPTEMTMNYMDYTDDACMYMFTAGQRDRILATFATGGPRNLFAQP